MHRQISAPDLKPVNSKSKRPGELGSSLHDQWRKNCPGPGLTSVSRVVRTVAPAGEEDEEGKLRKIILEQLQCLANHLAGNVVDFLIEEVEKKILNDYARAAMGEESNASLLDNSKSDSNSMADETEEDEEENDFEGVEVDDEEESEGGEEGRPRVSRGGLGSLYGGKSNGAALSPRGGGLYVRSIDRISSSGLDGGGGGGKNGRDGGLIAGVVTPRSSLGRGGYMGSNNSLSPCGLPHVRKTGKSDLSPMMPSRGFGGTRHQLAGPMLSHDADDEDDVEEDLIPSAMGTSSESQPGASDGTSLRPHMNLSSQQNSAKHNSLSSASSPKPSSGKFDPSNFEKGSPSTSPKRVSLPLGMSGFSPTRSPARVGVSVLSSPKRASELLNTSSLEDASSFQNEQKSTINGKQSRQTHSSSSPKGNNDKPGVGTFDSGHLPPMLDEPKRDAKKAPPSRSSLLLVKKGSVRHVTSMFESKDSRGSTRKMKAMPLLREDSVKQIMVSLAEGRDKLKRSISAESIGEDEMGTNPNEAPASTDEEGKTGEWNVTSPNVPGRSRTPPKMQMALRSSNQSPKRGVQRNTSGIRMQRFLENKTIERSSSGLKSFMTKKGSGSSNGSSGSAGKPSLARKTSGGRRGVERTTSGMRRGVRRTSSNGAGRRAGLTRQFSFGKTRGTSKSSSFGMFARDNVTNQLSNEARKQKRIFKTQNALRKLRKATELKAESELNDSNNELHNLLGSISIPLPCGVKHRCALLFVDVSGFTQLSTRLKVEQLSKTINAYFQLIVEHVQQFGGDILKFAGDAVFVEWRANRSSLLATSPDDGYEGKYGGDGLGDEKAVVTAAACAARIIDKCTDYDVVDEDGKKVATLNLHCAIGFGEVVGVHLGTSDRMEYFIIGEPIEQVALAMDLGKMGEVVASPECLRYLEGKPATEPKVILSKSNKFLNPKLMLMKPEKKKKSQGDCLGDRLDDWDILALKSLKKLMAPYVHPVVVDSQIIQNGYGSARTRATSEAEIRDVFTCFIHPLVSSQVTGDEKEDAKVLKTLHEIMVIVNNELRRFKGQLRQYTVDDKGKRERCNLVSTATSNSQHSTAVSSFFDCHRYRSYRQFRSSRFYVSRDVCDLRAT
jgi:class 3 adenylate cyclase